MTTEQEIRELIAAARAKGALIKVRSEACGPDSRIYRVAVDGGIPGVGNGWMPVIQAAERLREFVYAEAV